MRPLPVLLLLAKELGIKDSLLLFLFIKYLMINFYNMILIAFQINLFSQSLLARFLSMGKGRGIKSWWLQNDEIILGVLELQEEPLEDLHLPDDVLELRDLQVLAFEPGIDPLLKLADILDVVNVYSDVLPSLLNVRLEFFNLLLGYIYFHLGAWGDWLIRV